MIGASGDVSVYALNISKMITSIFGGMLTFQDQALADKVRAWRDANAMIIR
jgi:dTDP-4-amino-4,6-dideoxygalactose transaminase